MDRVSPFASRIQIDLTDGEFALPRSINPVQAWWPVGIVADIHLMFRRPLSHIETLVSMKPNTVIIHGEAAGDLKGMAEHLQKLGIKSGVALLPDTSVESVKNLIKITDHVLLFAGKLGSFGGHADMHILEKVAQVQKINPKVEIGWDGGANEGNAAILARAGVNVINVGSTIQKSEKSREVYEHLVKLVRAT